jgi:hypothetical protein
LDEEKIKIVIFVIRADSCYSRFSWILRTGFPKSANMQLLSTLTFVLAYIDPGTGSIIIQALVAAFAGAAIAVRLFWGRILKFFGVKQNTDEDPSSSDAEKEG